MRLLTFAVSVRGALGSEAQTFIRQTELSALGWQLGRRSTLLCVTFVTFVKCVCVAFVAVAGRRYAYTVCSLDDA